jgi:hypothetical protein
MVLPRSFSRPLRSEIRNGESISKFLSTHFTRTRQLNKTQQTGGREEVLLKNKGIVFWSACCNQLSALFHEPKRFTAAIKGSSPHTFTWLFYSHIAWFCVNIYSYQAIVSERSLLRLNLRVRLFCNIWNRMVCLLSTRANFSRGYCFSN